VIAGRAGHPARPFHDTSNLPRHSKEIPVFRRLLPFVASVLFLSSVAFAQGDYVAQTAGDAAVSLDVLELRIRPLKLEQVQVEADAWLDLLAAKNTEISQLHIQMKTATGEAQGTLSTRLAEETATRTRIVDGLTVVTSALKARGGETKKYDDYVAASTGSKLSDAGDVSGAFVMVKNWIVSPEGGIRLGLNILKFIATVIVFQIIARILVGLVKRAMGRVRTASALLRDFFANTVGKVTFFIGLVVALSMLEVDVTPFLAAIGAAGFVIGFALQGTLSNFACGIMILIYRPYDIGQVVNLAGTVGKVDKMTLVSTTLRLFDNQLVIIPNSKIWGDVITNITNEPTRRVDMKFGCAYSDDPQKVQQVLEDIVKKHPKVLPEPETIIRLHELGESSLNFVVRPWCRGDDYWQVFWDVTREVKRRFDEEGISIPFPQRDVHLYEVKGAD
jgi:small conductance mechanosensitive channel